MWVCNLFSVSFLYFTTKTAKTQTPENARNVHPLPAVSFFLSKLCDEMRQFNTPMKGGCAILNDYYDTILEYPVDTKQYLLDNQIYNGKYEVMEEFEALPRLYLTTDEQSNIAMIAPQLKNTMSYYSAKWILDGGVDAEWDGYLAELEAAGLQDYLAIYQSVYDRYMVNYNAAMNQ